MRKISKSEWNRKVAISRWKKVKERVLLDVKIKEKNIKYRILKAKLMGFLAGDGCICIRKTKGKKNAAHHDIDFYPDNQAMVTHFVNAFQEIYGKKPSIFPMKNYYKVRASNKPACLDLTKNTKFGTHEWDVPLNYLNQDILKIEWIKAFFDCEGYVGKKDIRIQSVNKKGLISIQKLLKEKEIESKIYTYERKNKNWNTNYILAIIRKDSKRKYYEKIGFNHTEKQKKLSKLVNASVPESG